MTVRKPKSEHKKDGRPTKYDKKFVAQAYTACQVGGFSEKNLAALFDVSTTTITKWKKLYPEFVASIRQGKDDYDSIEIEKSLGRIAKGFSHNETTKRAYVVKDEDGKEVLDARGKVKVEMRKVKVVRKMVAPNERAIEFWLRNRNRKRWPDKHDSKDSGDTKPLPVKIEFVSVDGRVEKDEVDES